MKTTNEALRARAGSDPDSLSPGDLVEIGIGDLREWASMDALCVVARAEEWHQRHAEHEVWAGTVAGPADKATEGVRTVRTNNGKAHAEYQIAPLPDGRHAVTFSMAYHCGDSHGYGCPWEAHPTREACVAAFLEAARRHFGIPVGHPNVPEDDAGEGGRSQREARKQMLSLLAGDGLFGFMEPDPVKPDHPDDDNDEDPI